MTNTKRTGVILLGVFIVLTLGVLSWQSSQGPSSEREPESPASVINKGFDRAQSLKGEWVRPDGGYRLVLEDIKPDGSLKASYFNPNNINVGISNWKVVEESVHLFVELRDVNYQGSQYSLVYMNETDELSGTYFQATQNQTFSIKFLRIIP